ncbi:MAG: hypothetical protein WC708_00535 [Lentisphaeria bacterium]|jgi:hypothetical protein
MTIPGLFWLPQVSASAPAIYWGPPSEVIATSSDASYSPDGTVAYVADGSSTNLIRLNTGNGTHTNVTLPVSNDYGSSGIFTPDGLYLFIPYSGGILKHNTLNGSVINIVTGHNYYSGTSSYYISPDGQYAFFSQSDLLGFTRINIGNDSALNIPLTLAMGYGESFSPDSRWFYIYHAHGNFTKIDVRTGATTLFGIGTDAYSSYGGVFSADNSTFYVAFPDHTDLYKFNTTTDAFTTKSIGGLSGYLYITPDRSSIMIPRPSYGLTIYDIATDSALNIPTNSGVSGGGEGIFSPDFKYFYQYGWSLVSKVDLTTHAVTELNIGGDINYGVFDSTISRDGNLLYLLKSEPSDRRIVKIATSTSSVNSTNLSDSSGSTMGLSPDESIVLIPRDNDVLRVEASSLSLHKSADSTFAYYNDSNFSWNDAYLYVSSSNSGFNRIDRPRPPKANIYYGPPSENILLGGYPSVTYSADKSVAFICDGTANLTRVDMNAGTHTVIVLPVAVSNSGVYTKDERFLFLPYSGGVVKLNAWDNTSVLISALYSPSRIVLSPNGLYLLINNNSPAYVLTKINIETSVISYISLGSTHSAYSDNWWVSPNSLYCYVFNPYSFTYGAAFFTQVNIEAETASSFAISGAGSPNGCSLVFKPDSSAFYCTYPNQHVIQKIDIATNAIVSTIDMGGASINNYVLTSTSDGSILFAPHNTGVARLVTATDTLTTISVTTVGTRGVLSWNDAYFYLYGTTTVTKIDVQTGATTNITIGGSSSYSIYTSVFSTDNNYLFVLKQGSSIGRLAKIKLSDNTVTGINTTDYSPYSLAISPDQSLIMVTQIDSILRVVISTMATNIISAPGLNYSSEAFSQADTYLYALNYSGSFYKIDR